MARKKIPFRLRRRIFSFDIPSCYLYSSSSGGGVGYANFASRAWETSFTPGVPSSSMILARALK
jgi:hypothetical protein